ncbi:MAG: GNAT family N-acetyltransferase [Candidatus Riflebacteria bacterium]|nr:GNAT family N-acetyltransferase [Candidatus Riflebacteria bacterium]
MISHMEFLATLGDEFNEELSNLSGDGSRVVCLPEDGHLNGAGWFLTYADVESGEWNLAHPFGTPSSYASLLQQFPRDVDFHLLVPETDFETFRTFCSTEPVEILIWHRDEGARCNESNEHIMSGEIYNTPDGYTWRFLKSESGRMHGFRGYLLHDDSIAALVRVIHETSDTIEIYVETLPNLRNQGLATALVVEMRERARAAARRLIYVVSATNAASLRVAEKAGLTPFARMLRILFRSI